MRDCIHPQNADVISHGNHAYFCYCWNWCFVYAHTWHITLHNNYLKYIYLFKWFNVLRIYTIFHINYVLFNHVQLSSSEWTKFCHGCHMVSCWKRERGRRKGYEYPVRIYKSTNTNHCSYVITTIRLLCFLSPARVCVCVCMSVGVYVCVGVFVPCILKQYTGVD